MDEILAKVESWIQELLQPALAAELGIALVLVLLGYALGSRLKTLLQDREKSIRIRPLRLVVDHIAHALPPLTIAALTGLATEVSQQVDLLSGLVLRGVTLLSLALALIHLIAQFVRDATLRKAVIWGGWIIAALAILGWLGPVLTFMDSMAITIGEARLSALSAVQGAGLLIVLIWLSSLTTEVIEGRLSTLPNVTPSARALIGKVLRIALIAIAILVAMTAIGIDITALAVFSGALGVGIGLGLQKVVSNFVSGLVLLADKSIKPGDVIEVGDAYGHINKLGARYVSVITRDAKEYLVPNEELLTTSVINWSFSDRAVRVRLPIGISYKSDVRAAIDLACAAAVDHERVLHFPETKCLLRGFGDSSVDLELRIWIADPENGIGNVSSDVLLRVWDAFHEGGIEFPFPQRDIHIKTVPEGGLAS